MKKFLLFTTFTCLTAFSAINSLSVMAGGCSSHRNKFTEIKCDQNDKECHIKNSEKFDLNKEIKS